MCRPQASNISGTLVFWQQSDNVAKLGTPIACSHTLAFVVTMSNGEKPHEKVLLARATLLSFLSTKAPGLHQVHTSYTLGPLIWQGLALAFNPQLTYD